MYPNLPKDCTTVKERSGAMASYARETHALYISHVRPDNVLKVAVYHPQNYTTEVSCPNVKMML